MYPSVPSQGNYGFNVALKPEVVDDKMQLEMATEATFSFRQGELVEEHNKMFNVDEKGVFKEIPLPEFHP
jgi:hypothetical protein